MSYESESHALDQEVLGVINAWHQDGTVLSESEFNDLAPRLFAYQRRYNKPYARYCERLGIGEPQSWEKIPAVPAPVFKEVAITTFDPQVAALTFETSGTTGAGSGRHYLENPTLYDASLLAAFDRFMRADGANLRYFNLVPNPLESRQSSLGYMMMRVAQHRGDGRTGWYLQNGELRFESLYADLQKAIVENRAVCLAATAFALAHLLDAMESAGSSLTLPRGSRVMETGGFKGRSRNVTREQLYERLSDRLGLRDEHIIAEYGMTELCSQYYDRATNAVRVEARRKIGPPWLRARVVGPDRKTLPHGEVGSLLHVDLANRSSCIAVQTEDMGVQHEDGFELLGRASDAERRGCSLDAEALKLRVRGSKSMEGSNTSLR